MTRTRIASLLAVSVLFLSGCGANDEGLPNVQDPNNLLGISGTGWFWIIIAVIVGVVVIAGEIFGD